MDPTLTSWTMVFDAAAGGRAARATFVERYESLVRAYLGARWRGSPMVEELEDTVQAVFIECFKEGGVLQRVEPQRRGGFRAFFYGALRNIARDAEKRRFRNREEQAETVIFRQEVDRRDEAAEEAFDRSWVRTLLEEAIARQATEAGFKGAEAKRRVELLRLRFEGGKPIREIARLWGERSARLHHMYADARQELLGCLRRVLGEHHPGDPDQAERELVEVCRSL
jgi:RNA polymerase sigma-70 factor (ECF subfamily)